MLKLKFYLKNPTKTLDIIKTKKVGDNSYLVWSRITVTEYLLFRRKVIEYYYYSTIEGCHPLSSVDVNTLDNIPDDHHSMIMNYFYARAFEKEMFGITPKHEAKKPTFRVIKNV